MLATVVSTAVPGQAVVDAGAKALAKEELRGAGGGYGALLDHPEVMVKSLSEEHGVLDLSGTQWRPRVGERVRVVPNHVCVSVNLQERLWGARGEEVVEAWEVAGRRRLARAMTVALLARPAPPRAPRRDRACRTTLVVRDANRLRASSSASALRARPARPPLSRAAPGAAVPPPGLGEGAEPARRARAPGAPAPPGHPLTRSPPSPARRCPPYIASSS